MTSQEQRELLEAAAKAAGISVAWSSSAKTMFRNDTGFDDDTWNPYTSHADLFDLAERCGLDLYLSDGHVEWANTDTNIYGWFRWPTDGTMEECICRAAVESKKGD